MPLLCGFLFFLRWKRMVAVAVQNSVWTRTPQPPTDTSVGCDCAMVGLSGQVSPFRQVWRFLVVFSVSNSFRTRGQAHCGACQPCLSTVINDLHTCVGPGKYHLSSPHLHARLHSLCALPYTPAPLPHRPHPRSLCFIFPNFRMDF